MDVKSEMSVGRRFELGDAAERPATDLLHREFVEPPFHEAEPRALRRGEVDVEAWAFGEPILDQRCLVGAVVVHDNVHVESVGARAPQSSRETPGTARIDVVYETTR